MTTPCSDAEIKMPFGVHRHKTLDQVPTDYLRWALRTVKPSTGIRTAVADELAKRGISPPPQPMKPEPNCPRCGWRLLRYTWEPMADRRKFIHRRCQRCGTSCGSAPQVEPYLSRANGAESDPGQPSQAPVKEAPAPPSPPPTAFIGWHRTGRGHRWKPLTRAATEREASQLLFAAARGGDFTTLREGIDPNVRKR
jgi:uncharacterized protein (DUF3820 family)